MPRNRFRTVATVAVGAAVVSLGYAVPAHAASFTQGNVVVCRSGDGAAGLSNTGAAIFLDEYHPNGVLPATLVQSVALPTTASGSNKSIFVSGTATSDCELNNSSDGSAIVLTGYRDKTASGSVANTTSAVDPRVIAVVSGTGAIDTSTALTDFSSGNNARAATSTGNNTLFGGGGAGAVAATAGSSTSLNQIVGTTTNIRQLSIFGGQLYESSGATTPGYGIFTIGTGTPTTAANTVTSLPFSVSLANTSPYGFFFAHLSNASAGYDTLYVTDDGAGNTKTYAGITKYSLVGGVWTPTGTVTAAAVRGLTGVNNNDGTVTLYGTTGGSGATGGGTLFTFTDTTGYNVTMSGTATSIATAATNTAFRGVALAPPAPVSQVPQSPLSLLLPLGAGGVVVGAIVLRRRRAVVVAPI